jgi:hypothetical protein
LFCAWKWTEIDDVNMSNLGGRTLVGGKTTTSKVRPTSHLFICCVESLSIVAHQIGLLLRVFGQASRFVGQLRGVVLSFAKKDLRNTFAHFT